MKRHAKVLLLVGAAFMVFGVSAALALTGHAPSPSNPFVSGLSSPQALAVNQENGDLYVLDAGTASIKRFDSTGAPADFSALGSNTIDGAGGGDCAGTPADCDQTPQNGFAFEGSAQVAVDSSGGPANGHVYVTNSFNSVVNVFDQTGAYVGRMPLVAGADVCGVTVDPTGTVYVADYYSGVYRYLPASDPVDSSFQGKLQNVGNPCNLAADASGAVYVLPYLQGPMVRYEASAFGEGSPVGTTIDENAGAAYVDPASGDVYVAEGTRLAHFDATGKPIQRFGSLTESRGVAIHAATGTVYGSDIATGEVQSFQPAVLPDVSTEAATAVTGTSATLHGTIDPAGGPEASCEFEYGTDTSYGSIAPCDPTGPFSTGPEAVSAALSGLTPSTVYHFRLLGSNAEGPSAGADMTFTTPGVPLVSAYSVSDVGSDKATLKAQIDPAGAATAYRFEYTTAADFEANGFANASKAPIPDGSVAAGAAQSLVQTIQGLDPATAYRFRLVATNSVGTTATGPKGFTTFPPPPASSPGSLPGQGFLPDDRAWEMVSPPDKSGGNVAAVSTRTRAADDGDAIGFISNVAFGDAIGADVVTDYVSVRSTNPSPGGNGWSTHATTPPEEGQSFQSVLLTLKSEYQGEFSADFDRGIYFSKTPITGDPNTEKAFNLYRRGDLLTPGAGSYQLLTACPRCEGEGPGGNPLPPGPETSASQNLKPRPAGASADLDQIIFESRQPLTVDAGTESKEVRLYEWDEGTVRLAGRTPVAPAIECDDSAGPACAPLDASFAGQGTAIRAPASVTPTPRTISDGLDGHSRVFFTRPSTDGTTTSTSNVVVGGNLYMRLDGTSTVQLNVSERTTPDKFFLARYQEASADGTRVFFSTRQSLTDDAPLSSEGAVEKLYMYDTTKPAAESNLTYLNPDEKEGDGGGLLGVIGASADGLGLGRRAQHRRLRRGSGQGRAERPADRARHRDVLRPRGPRRGPQPRHRKQGRHRLL